MHELADTYNYVFLSRPRRFGKSLLSSTFHSYFAGGERPVRGSGGGTAQEASGHDTRCSTLTCQQRSIFNEEQLQRILGYKLSEYEKKWGADSGIAEDDINARFERLVKAAVENTGEKRGHNN